ncbi:MAG: nucleotidyltransferase family protein [Leptolyngbyaceae cyanobacterium RU_5_1]|nr:nucleotidyltransferase family protein [Leptolyngbyaceae cyanobacterium RU_5_1]
MSDIGLVILAAGASSRMGTPKQLLHYQGRSLIRYAVETAIASVCHPILVVLGAYADHIKPELKSPNLQVIENPRWTHGMSTSIRIGVEGLKAENPSVKAVVLMVCDQPLVSTQLINQLVEYYQAMKGLIVAAEYAGILGVPALFDHTLFPDLIALNGDVGARQVIQRHAQKTCGVSYPAGAFDLDTPADYQQLLKYD